jgi:hypothetical protein
LFAEEVDKDNPKAHIEHPIAHQQSKIPPPVIHVPIKNGGKVFTPSLELAVLAEIGRGSEGIVDVSSGVSEKFSRVIATGLSWRG